jgi:hypothetical protein
VAAAEQRMVAKWFDTVIQPRHVLLTAARCAESRDSP